MLIERTRSRYQAPRALKMHRECARAHATSRSVLCSSCSDLCAPVFGQMRAMHRPRCVELEGNHHILEQQVSREYECSCPSQAFLPMAVAVNSQGFAPETARYPLARPMPDFRSGIFQIRFCCQFRGLLLTFAALPCACHGRSPAAKPCRSRVLLFWLNLGCTSCVHPHPPS